MWLCPVLSLSQHLFCCPGVFNGDVTLLKGKSQYTRYATQFTKPVTQLDTQLKILGFETGDLGYHSCRKGVATMLDAGCAVYPHIVALYILEGWVLGVVKYTYLFRKKSGDNYVGRYASCLDQGKITVHTICYAIDEASHTVGYTTQNTWF